MNRFLFSILLLSILLSSCTLTAQETTTTSTVTSPTSTISLPETPPPSATPTVTPTPIPTLEPSRVGGLEGVPDPKVTNPDLFDLTRPDAPIPQFVNAMRMAGREVTAEEVAEKIAFIDRKANGSPLVDKNGNQFVVGVYNLDPDPTKTGETLEGPISLLIATQNEKAEWEWNEATLGYYWRMNGKAIGVYVNH